MIQPHKSLAPDYYSLDTSFSGAGISLLYLLINSKWNFSNSLQFAALHASTTCQSGHYFRNRTEYLKTRNYICIHCSVGSHHWIELVEPCMLVPLLFRPLCLGNWMRKHEGGRSHKANSGCSTNTNPKVPVCRAFYALSSDI